MAEHANAAQKKLSRRGVAKTPPVPDTHIDEAGPESSSPAACNETVSAEAPSTESTVGEVQAEDAARSNDDGADTDYEDATRTKKLKSPVWAATAFGLAIVTALGTMAGWFGFQMYQSHQAEQQRELLVSAARQGAINLTTIDWQHVDADIQRILDSSSGAFYDDFSHRSKPFVDVVKKAQSKSVGTITEAGLESQSGNEAQVLVAISVKTSNLGAAEQDPRNWRMRITVQKVRDEVKVSNVAFVP